MLHSIGSKPKDDDRSLLGRLLDCHERIREMIGLASRLTEDPRPPDEEIAEAADRVRRYFKRALPLHVRDEEDSILPRLAHDAAAKLALERMRHEHVEHEPHVASIIATCEALRDAPPRWAELRAALRSSVDALGAAMRTHLDEEERDVFPRIAALLDEATRQKILDEMQERRDADGGGGRGRGGSGGGGRGRGQRST